MPDSAAVFQPTNLQMMHARARGRGGRKAPSLSFALSLKTEAIEGGAGSDQYVCAINSW